MSSEDTANEIARLENEEKSILQEEYDEEKKLHAIKTQIVELSFQRKAIEAKLLDIKHRKSINRVNRSLKTKQFWSEKQ